MDFWSKQRVAVTGGTGFLGSRLTAALRARGCAAVAGLGSGDYDLRRVEEAVRLYRELQPTLVVHLAAVVGGIGANRERPAEFFFDNLTMGLNVIDRRGGPASPKVVIAGTVCAYPKFAPVPFSEDDLWNGLSGGDERAIWPRQEGAAGAVAGLSRAVRLQLRSFCCRCNLYGPGDNFDPRELARHSGAHPQVHRSARRRARPHRGVGRRVGVARVSVRRGRRRGHPAAPRSATTAASPSISGRAGDPDSRSRSHKIAAAVGFGGDDRVGCLEAERAAPPPARRVARRSGSSGSRPRPASKTACARRSTGIAPSARQNFSPRERRGTRDARAPRGCDRAPRESPLLARGLEPGAAAGREHDARLLSGLAARLDLSPRRYRMRCSRVPRGGVRAGAIRGAVRCQAGRRRYPADRPAVGAPACRGGCMRAARSICRSAARWG